MTEEEAKAAAVPSDDDDDSGSENEEQKLTPEQKNSMLLTAVKENDIVTAEQAIGLGADVNAEENNWNSLLWAACNGNEDIVRMLIKNQAHLKYKKNEETNNEGDGDDDDSKRDVFKPPPDPAKTGKHTPLHWASYHGHIKVVWLLMKAGMDPLDQDIHGNNCIHQAAANSQLEVLKCFMSFGVNLTMKNARTHTPLDLATDPETCALIKQGIQ